MMSGMRMKQAICARSRNARMLATKFTMEDRFASKQAEGRWQEAGDVLASAATNLERGGAAIVALARTRRTRSGQNQPMR